jgi:acyl carrier protein
MAAEPGPGLVRADVAAQIHEFILVKLLPGEESINLTSTTPLVSGGIIDSLSTIQVGLFLEKAFGVQLAPEDLVNPEHMETIETITELVMSSACRTSAAAARGPRSE